MSRMIQKYLNLANLVKFLIYLFIAVIIMGLLFMGSRGASAPAQSSSTHNPFIQLDHQFMRLGLLQSVPTSVTDSEEIDRFAEVERLLADIQRMELESKVPSTLFVNFSDSVQNLVDEWQLSEINGRVLIRPDYLVAYFVAQTQLITALEQDLISRPTAIETWLANHQQKITVFLISLFVITCLLVLFIYRSIQSRSQLLESILKSHPDYISVKNYSGRTVYSNHHGRKAIQGATTVSEQADYQCWLRQQRKTEAGNFDKEQQIMRQQEPEQNYEDCVDDKTGKVSHSLLTRIPFRGSDNYLYLTTIYQNVTDVVSLKNETERNARRLESIFEVSNEGLWEWNVRTNEVGYDAQWEKITGVFASENHFEAFDRCIHDEDREKVHAQLAALLERNEPFNLKYRVHRSDGEMIWIWDRGKIAEFDENNKPLLVVGIMQDITQEKINQDKIERLAFFDPLTELPNRALFKQRLNQSIELHAQKHHYGAVLLINLDRFKLVNDTYDHQVGDELLIEVAQRIKRQLRAEDTVARFGGDEFAVVLQHLSADEKTAKAQALAMAEVINDALTEVYYLPYEEGKTHVEHFISNSIGGVVYNSKQFSVNSLVQMADVALTKAQQHEMDSSVIVGAEIQQSLNFEQDMKRELRSSIIDNRFIAYYQPKHDSDQNIVGAEALARWLHPNRGVVLPEVFMKVAEQTNLIAAVGDIMLKQVCEQLQRWQQQSHTKHLSLSVNVSAKQLRQKDFVDHFAATIGAYSIDPSLLTLEVSEIGLSDDIESIVEKLHRLKQQGVRLCLDDFGAGYASLNYLKELPVDEIKIDRSIIEQLYYSEKSVALIKSALHLGQNFQLTVIAEGVENLEQRNQLIQLGCQYFQGFHYSEAVSITEYEQLLSQ
ncbi:putative bifunctional diguanylate cyclase/phosphodiesterase [Reinekea thalattae]|uniref:EAL domain-containing protein n=1 Tax=Reinekea thalattae TaxID=2593301 RepID=A0A5C8Z833_9GAMM|nr:GGDEF domain-containing phosphodiesterase [Reinekea thalattae]TXR53006.1 EAL domain-containing protein [Reinekea thalattae]